MKHNLNESIRPLIDERLWESATIYLENVFHYSKLIKYLWRNHHPARIHKTSAFSLRILYSFFFSFLFFFFLLFWIPFVSTLLISFHPFNQVDTPRLNSIRSSKNTGVPMEPVALIRHLTGGIFLRISFTRQFWRCLVPLGMRRTGNELRRNSYSRAQL